MQALAMNSLNPFQASVEIFEGATRVKNIFINDYFMQESFLKYLPITDFLTQAQKKYPYEYDSVYKLVRCFNAFNKSIYKGQIIPCADCLRMFSENLMRHSEILMRLSSQNTSSNPMKLEDTCIELMRRKNWIDQYYNQAASNYTGCEFTPLVDNFYESNRLEPYDLAIVDKSLQKDFIRNKTIAFDTAFNSRDIYCKRLQFIDKTAASNIQADFDFILSFCTPSEFSIVKKNIPDRFISKPSNVYEAINDYTPFIKTEDYYYTNATLVSRYIANRTSNTCEKNKKYQIHSGFIFEQRMKNEFNKNKYDLIDIKRTHTHREFDVIIKDKSTFNIINIQCKNFAINLYNYRSDISFAQRRLGRVMSRLQAALQKEISRESALINELQLRNIQYNKIKHIVVSKQQIPSNDDIMDYSHFLTKYG